MEAAFHNSDHSSQQLSLMMKANQRAGLCSIDQSEVTSHSPLSLMLSLLNGSLSSPQPFATQKSFMNRNSLNQADSVQTVGRPPQGDSEGGRKDMKILHMQSTHSSHPSLTCCYAQQLLCFFRVSCLNQSETKSSVLCQSHSLPTSNYLWDALLLTVWPGSGVEFVTNYAESGGC